MNTLTLILAAAAIVIGFSACEPGLVGHQTLTANIQTAFSDG
ncbi:MULTISPECIES: hypothetical protein [Nguyenibacter]|uniref:Uncharacterized protein n=1 Tax=Nguyenibacter vanlangensis TaxID=1216886 RepID=A0ABZ3D194_9PROT|nr:MULTISPECIES: hypothetical protein [Nguyenibacter]WRH86498.1 hypothetical protein QN315_10680 [Nguyenibacter sp. L1]